MDLQVINQQLMKRFDATDPFMRGHQILKTRRGWRKKNVPAWVTSDKTIRELVLRSFPKLKTNDRQRRAAATWIRVINLYFRMGWTRGQVAEELKTTPQIIQYTVRRIQRVSVGRRADGRGLLGAPKGRPKKHAPTETDVGRAFLGPHEDNREVGAGSLL